MVPDTGTRPQTKQDRAGAGCHAQSPSSRKPERCSGGFGGKRGHRISGDDSRGETRASSQLWEEEGMLEIWPYSRDGDLHETNTRDRVTETREVDCPDMEGRDLLGLTLSSLDYPHWI